MKGLVVGAGVTGCYTAVRMADMELDVALLARGDWADRLERDGLPMRDGITGEERTAWPRIVRAPVEEAYYGAFDYAMVCVQESQRQSLEPLLNALPGQPVIWYLGNTSQGFDRPGELLGRDRVLGGFPSVGGTWEGGVLLYADRQKPRDEPFDALVIGEAFPEGTPAAVAVRDHLRAADLGVEHHVPIMAWHWSHLAMVLPLAGAVYRHDGDLEATVADKALLEQTMRATSQALTAVRDAGHPILPSRLKMMRWVPAWLGARKIGKLFSSDFGRIALAGHASTARGEMRTLAADLLALADDDHRDLRELMDGIQERVGQSPERA